MGRFKTVFLPGVQERHVVIRTFVFLVSAYGWDSEEGNRNKNGFPRDSVLEEALWVPWAARETTGWVLVHVGQGYCWRPR